MRTFLLLLGGLVVTGVSAILLPLPLQILVIIVTIAIAAGAGGRAVFLAVILSTFLGLLRRLLAEEGRVEFDPLIVLPYAVALLGVLTAPRGAPTQRIHRASVVLALVAIASAGFSVLVRTAFSADAIFYTGAYAVSLLVFATAATGRLDAVWPPLERILPWAGLVAGVYGVFQFFVLPEWDRLWMVASELTTIGQPYPEQVRVFGMSESPAPYAALLGVAILVCYAKALRDGGGVNLVWLVVLVAMLPPLMFSGVRTVLLGIVVAIAFDALFRARGAARIVAISLLFAVPVVVTFVIDRFGGNSSILTAERYTDFGADDYSLTARGNLFAYFANPFRFIIGYPGSPPLDNHVLYFLNSYGLAAAVAMTAITVIAGIAVVKLLRARRHGSIAMCAALVLTVSAASTLDVASWGILALLVLGLAVRYAYAGPDDPASGAFGELAVQGRVPFGDARPVEPLRVPPAGVAPGRRALEGRDDPRPQA